MLTDEQMTEGILRTEEFPTEPAALARARELLEDVDCKAVFVGQLPRASECSRRSIEAGADRAPGESPDNRLRCSSCRMAARIAAMTREELSASGCRSDGVALMLVGGAASCRRAKSRP